MPRPLRVRERQLLDKENLREARSVSFEGHGIETTKNSAARRQEAIYVTDRAIRVQYGALPYRFTDTDSLEVLLVTTRQIRRWIIPKGWPIKGLKPPSLRARSL